MTLAKRIQELSEKPEEMVQLRYVSAKSLFLACTLLFFLNYFFVGAGFYYDAGVKILPFTYILFVYSLFLYSFFAIQKKIMTKVPTIVSLILFLVLAIIFSIFTLSFLFSLSHLL